MKKPFKVLSTTALATVFMASAVVPAMAAEVPTQKFELTNVIVEQDGEFVSLTLQEYKDYLLEVDYKLPDNEKAAYVTSSTGKKFTLQDYKDYLLETDYNPQEALSALENDSKEKNIPTLEGSIKDGQIVVDGTSEEKVNETFFYNLAA